MARRRGEAAAAAAATREAYDTVALDYARMLPDLAAEAALDVAMIDDFATRCLASGRGRVLDAGCGTGRVGTRLAGHGLEVVGVDLSPGMLEVARDLHPGRRFEVGSLADLPLADGAVGGVLAWYSVIHTAPEDLDDVARELARVLVPGGWLLVAFQAGSGERVDRRTAYGHDVEMTSYRHHPDRVATLLRAAGVDEVVRMVRRAAAHESADQAVLLAQRRA
ncbi:class I SAM-dependent DNA methyltransferase [Serinibacter arcticus]|uniref:class I SAM-dependent DNA methyltransferase n=1 Tax=Serinibacter arcticus TaxID=1655435 RepID=UPI001F39D77E|nr:class I SAM-dependent methyltransferase [Serinibacter arcticus]